MAEGDTPTSRATSPIFRYPPAEFCFAEYEFAEVLGVPVALGGGKGTIVNLRRETGMRWDTFRLTVPVAFSNLAGL
jgi:hypothetical protein